MPAVKHLAERGGLSFHKKVTFLVGENGTGKSTLIEAIAVAFGFNAEGGTKNFNFSTRCSHSDLHKHLLLSKSRLARDGFFLRAESFYNVASNIEAMDEVNAVSPPIIDSYGGVSLHNQSHGESFMSLVQNRLGGNGLYIFDEPEAALSPMRLMALIVKIDELVKRDSQFIIATHSPILLSFPDAEVLELSADGISSVDYRETEHYKVTKRFMENPERMIRYLLED
ncbi:MAG: AAA family ATPase [Clostridiales bacterium]|nr:AAA family ATPase [Clostridiales bacterium]